MADRHGLWADEFFSLAMATGHSLEHPAVEAVPALGDFVESPGAEPATRWRRYLEHEDPPASAARVVRAVLLSDTSPPLYYLLLYGWTRAFGTTDLDLRLFSVVCSLAAFPLLYPLGSAPQRTASRPRRRSALQHRSHQPVLLGRRADVFPALVPRPRRRMAQPAASRSRPEAGAASLLLTLTGAAGLLAHYFFVFVWAACLVWLWLYPGRISRAWLAATAVLTGLLVLPWYLQVPESLARWRITGRWLEGGLSLGQAVYRPAHPRLESSLRPRSVGAETCGWTGSGSGSYSSSSLAVGRKSPRSLLSRNSRLVWLWLLFACAGPLIFDLLRGTHASQISRYALPAVPAAMLLAGMALNRLGPPLSTIFLALVVVAWLPGIRVVFLNGSRSWDVYRQVAVRVAEWAGPSDLVIVHSIPSGVVGIARYVTSDTPVASWVEQLGGRRVPEDVIRLLHGRERVALVVIHSGAAVPEEGWLQAHATSVGGFQMLNARVLSFRRSGRRIRRHKLRPSP